MADIIPTVVPKSLDDVARIIGIFPEAPIHIDIADGRFAPNTTWTLKPGEKLPDATRIAYEVHLMVENPLQQGMMFARAGTRRIIAHVESFDHAEQAREAFKMWQAAGASEIGIGVLFSTPIEALAPYVALCDFVHLMTIATVGKQGIPFESRSPERVAAFHTRYPSIPISVDGGGNKETIVKLKEAGATRFCIGSALAKAKNPHKTFEEFAGL